MLEAIRSGGQTGVDRAALDAALDCRLPIGGWCPAGRRAEDGIIPTTYPLRETSGRHYAERTKGNVRDSDATLILYRGEISGGTAQTRSCARRLGKPCLAVDMADARMEVFADWLREHDIRILNVAGPRESQRPGIHAEALALLKRWFSGVRPQ